MGVVLMEDPEPYQPASRHIIPGRGTIFVGPYPFTCSPRNAFGRRLLVEGEIFLVRGIEWRDLDREPREGDTVGLLVRQV